MQIITSDNICIGGRDQSKTFLEKDWSHFSRRREYIVKSKAKTHIDNDCWSLDYIYRLQSGWTCLTYGNLCCPKWKPRQIVDDDQIGIFRWWCSTLWRIKSRSKHNSKPEEHCSCYLKCIHNSIYAQLKAWVYSNRATTRIYAKKPFIVIECNYDCFGFSKFPINNCVLYSPGWTNLKTTIKAEILPLKLLMTNWWLSLFPVNVFRSKFAAAGLPINLRNVHLASFFRLYFCCLLDEDLKGQCK